MPGGEAHPVAAFRDMRQGHDMAAMEGVEQEGEDIRLAAMGDIAGERAVAR